MLRALLLLLLASSLLQCAITETDNGFNYNCDDGCFRDLVASTESRVEYMYGQRMFCAEDRLPPNYDLFGDGDFQLLQSPSPSQLYTTQQQPWSSGDNMGPAKSSTTMLSRFKSPASAFYAAEELMGFPQNPKTPDAEFPLYRSSCESFSINSAEKGYQDSSAATKILPPQRQNILAVDDAAFALRRKVSFNSYSSYHHVPQLSFSSHQEKQQFSKFSCTSNSSANTSTTTSTFGCPVLPNKTRIRWTQDLHEKFVECVNRLGGAEKATPKAILKLMDTDGLTIFHIKSHLQKYRIAKYIPDSAEGRSDRRTSMNDVTRLDVKNGLQIKEALQLQLDVQRQLHEQLEIQRNLQLRIEEQGRQLRMMFNQQQKQSTNTLLLDNNQDDDDKSLEDSLFSVAADGSDDSYFHSKIS